MHTTIIHTSQYEDIYTNEAEHDGLILAISGQLLVFFDRIKYCADRNNFLLGFIGEIGDPAERNTGNYWVAQQSFIAREWLGYYRNDTLVLNFIERLRLINYQLKQSNPQLHAKRCDGVEGI